MQLTHHHLLFPVYSKKEKEIFVLFQNPVSYYLKNEIFSWSLAKPQCLKLYFFTLIEPDEFRGRVGAKFQTFDK